MSTVVISLDSELAWGFHDLGITKTSHKNRVKNSRDAWKWLVKLFEKYRIPCTWGIVGHLFIESCSGKHEGHPITDDWFSMDPGGNESKSPHWFGSDLIKRITQSRVAHEIGSHSFSHVEFGNEETTKELVSAELERCVSLAEEWNISLDSFIFPRNNVGHLDLVKQFGFKYYRGAEPSRWKSDSVAYPMNKYWVYSISQSAPPLVKPEVVEEGLINISGSVDIFSTGYPLYRLAKTMTEDPIVRQVRLGLDSLRNSSGSESNILHLRLHPNDLFNDWRYNRMENIVSLLAHNRDEYGIEIKTMSMAADELI